MNLSDMISLVRETLHEQPYTKEEVVQKLETTTDHLDATSLTQNTKHIKSFKLRQRALHVFQGKWNSFELYICCIRTGRLNGQTTDTNKYNFNGEVLTHTYF